MMHHASKAATSLLLAVLAAAAPARKAAAQDAGPAADSLYRAGRDALNRRDFATAARVFAELRDRHARSTHAPDSYYWEALALSRRGTAEELARAAELLAQQASRFPQAPTRSDAAALRARLLGMYAATLDSARAHGNHEHVGGRDYQRLLSLAHELEDSLAHGSRANRQCRENEEHAMRLEALRALVRVGPDQGMPILTRVLQMRDECSVELRWQAAYILAQYRTPQAQQSLVAVLEHDPEPRVREAAIRALHGFDEVNALIRVAGSDSSPELRATAVTILASRTDPQVVPLLRDIALADTVPARVRVATIIGLANRNAVGATEVIRRIAVSTDDEEVASTALSAGTHLDRRTAPQWLLSVAADTSVSLAVRMSALRMLPPESGTEVRDALVNIVRNGRPTSLRRTALQVLVSLDDPRVPELLNSIIQ